MEQERYSIDMEATGNQIRMCCKQKGITVKDIQETLKIGAFQSIYNWFNGKTLPSLDNFYALSKLLNIPIDKMIVGMDKKEERNADTVLRSLKIDFENRDDVKRDERFHYYLNSYTKIAA